MQKTVLSFFSVFTVKFTAVLFLFVLKMVDTVKLNGHFLLCLLLRTFKQTHYYTSASLFAEHCTNYIFAFLKEACNSLYSSAVSNKIFSQIFFVTHLDRKKVYISIKISTLYFTNRIL